MKATIVSGLLAISLAQGVRAQPAELDLSQVFHHLERKATDVVNVDIGPLLLKFAGKVIDKQDPEQAAVGNIIRGLKSVRVRHFEFADDNAYSLADIESVRAQLSGANWTPIVKTHDRHRNENVDIYISVVDDHTNGIAIIAVEPREFTVVNIVGSVRLEDLAGMQKQLNIPGLHLHGDVIETVPAGQI